MITMKATPGQAFKALHSYTADDNGTMQVHAEDVADLQSQGAATGILPATINLKAAPGQQFYFMSKTYQADARGLITDVPFDFAVIQIKEKACVEATDADLDGTVAPAPEVPAPDAPAQETAPSEEQSSTDNPAL